MTTKQLIYQKALELFSRDGYQNVGMRELAKEVGIKAASIYNHYKSKEEILLELANTLILEMEKEVYPLFKEKYNSLYEFLINTSLKTNLFFEKTSIMMLTNILIPEQYNSLKLKELFLLEFIVKPRGAYTYYFKNYMDKNEMKKDDPKLAAKLYHSFFIYHFYEMNLSSNNSLYFTNHKELFINHIDLFVKYYSV